MLPRILAALIHMQAETPDDPAERAEHELGPVRVCKACSLYGGGHAGRSSLYRRQHRHSMRW
jgi:hypothetical protein